ncbi:MAG: ferrous iron transporter B [Candidatus Omnitrophica bacterium]|nr:ferrous iron transporter B [Candidatus Omnitrophota bacterium]MDD5770645.1 ferrous iron transporter B [Candidatus Omnitrophota bacterium]
MIKKIFLVGNPNVGKSVIFSRLTGVQVISSNYAGTTVEIMRGFLKLGRQEFEVIDLPGTYSLEPGSKAEEVVVSMLNESSKEEIAVINIVDSTNLERNLYLTLQLLETGLPVVVCLNMCDEAKHHGVSIDTALLGEALGIPVVPTCAVTGLGIKALIEKIENVKIVSRPKISHRERWQAIGEIVEKAQHLTHRHHSLRELLEDASVRPFSGALIAAGVIFAAFKIVRFIGEGLINLIADPVFVNFYQPFLDKLSLALRPGSFLHHLLIGDLVDGRIDFKQSLGLLTTAPYIEFAMVLPYIVAFYLVLGLLEDIGILPRLAMLLDNLLHHIGLHGFAIIPVLLGLGCNVPGILATRNLESRRERFIAATLISIGIPCVALQAMIFGLLGKSSGFYVSGVYLVLLVIWVVLGVILNHTVKGYSPELLVEIPPYRLPSFSTLWKKLFLRIKGFIIEAAPLVLLGVLIINVLLYFKLFGLFTGLFEPVVQGLFGLPKEAVVALVMGLFRKDVAVGMLIPLALSVKQLFIAAVLLAVSFPCAATFVVFFKELGFKDLLKASMIMCLVALATGGLLNFLIH